MGVQRRSNQFFIDVVFFLLDSCKDIYSTNRHSPNGTYTIFNRKNQPYKVYCEFHSKFGYTYISKNSLLKIDMNDLFTTTEHVKIRHVKADGVQTETVLENIERYKNISLAIFYNHHPGYATPINSVTLAPYLYLGFLPIQIASHVGDVQGYRASNQDVLFTNCDAQPNSYFVFYFNPGQKANAGYGSGWYTSVFINEWISLGNTLSSASSMPPEFYFDYEIHFGGCGGYKFHHQEENKDGAALGLRFGIYIYEGFSYFLFR